MKLTPDIKDEMTKSYDPKKVEGKWYQFWEENGFFKADSRTNKKP